MEKIFGIIKKALLSEMLNRIILDVCIVALLGKRTISSTLTNICRSHG